MNLNRLAQFAQRLPGQGRPIFLTCIFGLGAGLGAVAFQQGMNWLYNGTLVQFSHQSTLAFLLGSLLVVVTTSLIVGYLLTRFAPTASGSGIPQLKLAFWKDFGFVPWRVVWVKYVAGVLSIGGGCSLGREGPSVQLAGGLASHLAGLLGEPKQRRRMAAAAGAAAGLAAAFNTPLAATTFVLEEIIADLNSSLLGSVLLASVIGALVVHGLVGRQPAFHDDRRRAFRLAGLCSDARGGRRGGARRGCVPEGDHAVAGAAQGVQARAALGAARPGRRHHLGVGLIRFFVDRPFWGRPPWRVQPGL